MTREDEIFEKLKNGDESGAAELVRLYYEDILRYCMFRLPDRYLAEDAVQETFLKVFRYFDDYRHKGRFRAFLYKVAGNTCIDIMRKKQWHPIPEDAAQEESGMRKTEEQEDFLRIIRKLPPELGEVVFLRFSQELRLREIAETVGIPLRTVQSRLRRALELLRTELEREGEAEEEGNRSNEIEIRKEAGQNEQIHEKETD